MLSYLSDLLTLIIYIIIRKLKIRLLIYEIKTSLTFTTFKTPISNFSLQTYSVAMARDPFYKVNGNKLPKYRLLPAGLALP